MNVMWKSPFEAERKFSDIFRLMIAIRETVSMLGGSENMLKREFIDFPPFFIFRNLESRKKNRSENI